ncbi:hypothetical protein C7999DRAFT_28382 [Corynascus novoguineensis]|uniref:Lytic polysaccharide monooxygenase n=1 Tax=Corynascus novoguineensis TaxID=1126955 RepID=A0AAN7D1Q8_9PEZI|nr:hypothetical protein C7999DRAFT_28382 [Corynascus novoguineensis]
MLTLKSLILAGGLAALTEAHMILRKPAPFTSPAPNQSPISMDGSDYPCHSNGGAFSGTATQMEKGSKQELAFTGSAVHGGGSCQVSITYDEKPTKESSFKVIHSIEGGCPARAETIPQCSTGNLEGCNLPGDASMQTPDTYEFTIPEDLPSGKATLAWTWFNSVGNREFYMMCAPVEITGSGGSESALAGLPDMAVANTAIAGTCTTEAGKYYKFPNPGKSVETNEGWADFVTLGGECVAPGGSGSGSGSGNTGGSATPAAEMGAPTPAVRGRRPYWKA